MRLALTTLAACLLAAPGYCPAAAAPPENPCTNGSFEKLTPAGFPVDWEAVGQGVGVSKDARTGTYSLRIVRTAEAKTPITGLNRAWRGRSGQQGAMLDRRAGGIDFWYKAVKVLGFQPTADGEWHEYVLRPGEHAEWKGRITAIRIDTGNGAASGEFGLDYVRGGRE